MAELSTIARPYARAAFASASALRTLAQWSAALARAAEVVSDERVGALIGNPRVQPAQLTEMIFELASGTTPSAGKRKAARRAHSAASEHNAHSSEELHNLLRLLAQNRRLRLLPQIAAQFEALRADAENSATVDVRTALALTPEQSQRLQSALEQRLGRTVRLQTTVDPKLIGGAVVQYGDFILDGSLRRSLERLGSEISGP